MHISIAVLFLTKSSQRTSSQHLPFRSLNGNTRVGHERCSRFIKSLPRQKSIVVVHLIGFTKGKGLEWYWQYFNADSLTYS